MADIAGRHQSVDAVLGLTTRVPIKAEVIADEDAACHSGLDDGSLVLIEKPHYGAARRPPGRPGRIAEVAWAGNRCVRGLGRSIEVVKNVAEPVHHPQRQLACSGSAVRCGCRARELLN